MYRKYLHLIFYIFLLANSSCTNSKKEEEPKLITDSIVTTSTPVTVTSPETGIMKDEVEVNAVSAYLLKTYVKANANGYLQMANATLGKYVTKGEKLFVIKTKEAESLGNTITSLDTGLHFNGVITIASPGSGYISQINYQSGDYVQDGEQLAIITDTRSFVFLLDLPYELTPLLQKNKNLQLKLPDGSIVNGTISNAMPTVDAVSQTQHFVIPVNTNKQIPENLIAKVMLVKDEKNNATLLPKAAVLSNEVQTEFWIMKMIDSTTAIKILITKGLENESKIEIKAPALSATDKILISGNFGLPDTAKVSVTQK